MEVDVEGRPGMRWGWSKVKLCDGEKSLEMDWNCFK